MPSARPVPSVTGNGLTRPTPPNGSSSEPTAAPVSRSSYPKGQACMASVRNCPATKSPRQAIARAHRRPAVAVGIPGHANTRLEVHPVGLQARLARKARIAGVGEPGHRIGVHLAARVGEEGRGREVVDRPVRVLLREPGFVPHPVVHRDLVGDAPGVLAVDAEGPSGWRCS